MFLIDKLMFFINKEDVYIGYSIEEVSKIISILKEKNIQYTHKVLSSIRSKDRISMGMFGMNKKYETQYIISVKESDYEEAKYLVNKALHEKNSFL